jgi:hypothetical protein
MTKDLSKSVEAAIINTALQALYYLSAGVARPSANWKKASQIKAA